MSNSSEISHPPRNTCAWIVKISVWILVLGVVTLSYVYPRREYIHNYITRLKGRWYDDNAHCTNEERKRHVEKICTSKAWGAFTNRDTTSNQFYKQVIVDDEHQLLYCAIPRVAELSIKTLLMTASKKQSSLQNFKEMIDNRKFIKSFGLRFLDEYDDGERAWRLENYFKFIVVRHPFERLHSSYIHQVLRTDDFRKLYYLDAVIKFGARVHGENGNMNMQLDDFLGFIQDPSYTDLHWDTYDNLCHPCDIAYDQILKLETIEADSEPLLRILSAHGITELPQVNVESPLDNDKLLTSSVAFDGISKDVIKGLRKIYKKDMDVFGYTWDHAAGLSCGAADDKGKVCC